jgi:hypothetical protein
MIGLADYERDHTVRKVRIRSHVNCSLRTAPYFNLFKAYMGLRMDFDYPDSVGAYMRGQFRQ